jgi:hypothetical protein
MNKTVSIVLACGLAVMASRFAVETFTDPAKDTKNEQLMWALGFGCLSGYIASKLI